MARQTHTVTIANGASLSEAIDLGEQYSLSAIQLPAAWTAASLSIEGSVHPTILPPGSTEPGTPLRNTLTYTAVTDAAGAQITYTVAADKIVSIPKGTLDGIRYIKLRSGTTAAAVVQGAARTINLVAAEV